MSALRNHLPPQPPTDQEARLARESSRMLAACIGQGDTARLKVINGDEEIVVPINALRMLVDILANMAEGKAISILPINAELTTQQVADFLGVSRPYVVGLIERNELPHHKVGTHRRVRFQDLLDYQKARLEHSHAALDELTTLSQSLGMGY